MLKIYFARKMTGRTGADLIKELAEIEFVCWKLDVVVLDPVKEEKIKSTDKEIRTSLDELTKYWARDKEMIREAHVIIDCTGPLKSEGVAHEIGYARYYLWKPVIRVYPEGLTDSVANLEDDLIVSSIEQAVWKARFHWGSRLDRIKWRFNVLKRCLFKFIQHQIGEWK